jgi:hypothetical protein
VVFFVFACFLPTCQRFLHSACTLQHSLAYTLTNTHWCDIFLKVMRSKHALLIEQQRSYVNTICLPVQDGVEGARTLNAGKGMQSINLQRAMWSVTEKVADLLKLMPFFCRLCFLTQIVFVCCSCVLGKKVIKNTDRLLKKNLNCMHLSVHLFLFCFEWMTGV